MPNHLIVYCGSSNQNNIKVTIGNADYSYYFIYRELADVLSRLGQVHLVDDLDGVEALYDQLSADGSPCVLLSITPPHKAPVGLRCPVVCVFAWEFSTIPTETWDEDPRNDWRHVFAAHGKTITLSEYAARAVRAAMGNDYPMLVIPTPVWERLAPVRAAQAGHAVRHNALLPAQGMVLDSRVVHFSPDALIQGLASMEEVDDQSLHVPLTVTPAQVLSTTDKRFLTQTGQRTANQGLVLKDEGDGFWIYGPYLPWQAGAYAVTVFGRAQLPQGRTGWVDVSCHQGQVILARRDIDEESLKNAGPTGCLADLTISLENDCTDLEVRVWMPAGTQGALYSVEIAPAESARDPADAPGTSLTNEAQEVLRPGLERLVLNGVVYTAVLNPNDGRKNWEDMLSAFCWTFRDVEDATLLIKASQHDFSRYGASLQILLSRLAPFKCRVICIQAYLDDAAYAKLIQASSYYVNSSVCEGLCIPILEFMSCGVPAIAPGHTAMADYIDAEVAFVLTASTEMAAWPHDPRKKRHALRYRMHWDSLCTAYRESYLVAKQEPERYEHMRQAGLARMREYADSARVQRALETFLQPQVQEHAAC
ncbi:MAG: glycosyltransferase [Pseudomonadota bacterium]|nr:glycosyltransferase [Pseudomonadota bacterium]